MRLGNPTKASSATLKSSFFTISAGEQGFNGKQAILLKNYSPRISRTGCSIKMDPAWNFLEFEEGGFLYLSNLLLDNFLKGLVVYEAWQLSSSEPLFILNHILLNFTVDCKTNEQVRVAEWVLGPWQSQLLDKYIFEIDTTIWLWMLAGRSSWWWPHLHGFCCTWRYVEPLDVLTWQPRVFGDFSPHSEVLPQHRKHTDMSIECHLISRAAVDCR